MAKKLVNSITNKSVPDFLEKVKNKTRRADALRLLEMMERHSGEKAHIWGVSIVGFGRYPYQRKNGDQFEWFNVGFSPGSAHSTIYVMFDLEQEDKLLSRLGPHKIGRSCLYIKKLDDVNIEVLEEIILKSIKTLRH